MSSTVLESGRCGDSVPSGAMLRTFAVELLPASGFSSPLLDAARNEAVSLGIDPDLVKSASRGFLLAGDLSPEQASAAARELLAEPVVHCPQVRELTAEPSSAGQPDATSGDETVHVLYRPGVTDPEAETALGALRSLGYDVCRVRTFRRFTFDARHEAQWRTLLGRALANESIEQIVTGGLCADAVGPPRQWSFARTEVPLRDATAERLLEISRTGTLSLTLVEMQAIQAHYRELGREPTEAELETIAQTWSEHCSHKTLRGRVEYSSPEGSRTFHNLLRETIFAATQRIREELGEDDWCVSVFRDNAGVVRFDDRFHVTFKVETHNRPSAIEPYGGANTGLGGVIRDTLGTGLGARPICSTDVFCFAPPDMEWSDLPPGVLHPRRLMQRVVAGVRDYGNRMGIPTVNGAIWFDPRYVGNPMVFCGNVGLLPAAAVEKRARDGDLIVALGGRTGRDGIHGATFSSVELHESSQTVSSGAVQIGNAITEKMLADVLLQARDQGLYHAVTDCGAGGFSSAVGEMGEETGAEVQLELAPLKYEGLSATEVWISEAQERMVLAVPPEHWDRFHSLCRSEDVEATVIGRFVATGELKLTWKGQEVGRLSMKFLHEGRPPVVRSAVWNPPPFRAVDQQVLRDAGAGELLLRLLAHPNIASKHWVIRQYDHEVQGGSVIKPLCGVHDDGPSDAAVVRPVLDSRRGITVSCGMNPLLGDLDPGYMAAAAIDEAVRNAVATGADPDRIGILDNFCWGYTDRPVTLGSLVRAALACHDAAVAMRTPFISGKDSLNNEFSYTDETGGRRTVSIPPTLLISAIGQVADVDRCVTMDWKEPGNVLFLVGTTGGRLGGSHALWLLGQHGRGAASPPDPQRARKSCLAIHAAMQRGLISSCHDCSEGGLAIALAEMAIAGDCGAEIDLRELEIQEADPADGPAWFARLFSETPSRLVCEVRPSDAEAFLATMDGHAVTRIGTVSGGRTLRINAGDGRQTEHAVDALRQAWRGTLDWR